MSVGTVDQCNPPSVVSISALLVNATQVEGLAAEKGIPPPGTSCEVPMGRGWLDQVPPPSVVAKTTGEGDQRRTEPSWAPKKVGASYIPVGGSPRGCVQVTPPSVVRNS